MQRLLLTSARQPDKRNKGLWCKLLKSTLLSSNSVIPVVEKHFGTVILTLLSILPFYLIGCIVL